MSKGESYCSTSAMQNHSSTSTAIHNNARARTTTTPPTSTTTSISTNPKIRSVTSSFNNEDVDEDCGILGQNNGLNPDSRNRSNSILSSYLILSPSNPIRIFAISFLTHWIYPTVIVLTVCAFVISSVYSTFHQHVQPSNKNQGDGVTEPKEIDPSRGTRSSSILEVTRWVLFIALLSEILIKSMARGFFVGSKFAYLRILWDWMDIVSLVFIFLSIIIPWKSVEFMAAAVVLLKLIPIHPGSINAFIFLCSCAKKLIPVLLYGLIIVWIYGFIIFALFVKYQHPHQEGAFVHHPNPDQLDESNTNWDGFAGVGVHVTRSNGSTSDTTDENGNITENVGLPTAGDVDGAYLFPPSPSPTIVGKWGNFSRGLAAECLPTNFRSLSGSFIQAIEMLTLRYSPSSPSTSTDISKSTYSFPPTASSRGTTPSLNLNNETRSDDEERSWSCQYETYVLSIIETLVIISGTLPMIIMSYGALSHLFERTHEKLKSSQNQHHYRANNEEDEHDKDDGNFYHRQRVNNNDGNTNTSLSSESHRLSSCGPVRPPSSWFNSISNLLCDCDYYFCCLANLQRRLGPGASGILNSKKFKVFVVLIVSTDFLAMSVWCGLANSKSTSDIDFPTTLLIIYYWIQICFILYTAEAVFRWFTVSSDEYWMTVWPAFDLTMVLIYWIGFIVLHVRSYQIYYPTLAGILMIRLLKIVPYWKTLEHSLKLILFSVSSNRQNLLVILLCSCSCILLKYAAFFFEARWSSQLFPGDLILSLPPDFYTFVESMFRLVLYFPCCVVIVTSFGYVIDNLRSSPPGEVRVPDTMRNPSISLLLNDSPQSHDAHFIHDEFDSGNHRQFTDSRRSFNASPISVLSVPNGISHSKFMFANSPCGSHNGLLMSNDTRSSILSPSSEVLSPLLSVPIIPNGLNGHGAGHHHHSSHLEDHEENSQLPIGSSARSGVKRESFFHPRRPVSVEDMANLTTAVVVILASVNISLNSSEDDKDEMSWHTIYFGKSLWLEVLFIMGIALHLVYKTRLSRFCRDTFMQISSVIDLVVILAAAMNVFSSGMGWVPSQIGEKAGIKVFAECAKILSSARGLLLLSRISWLQCVGSGLCYVIWKVIKHLAAFGYFWTIFVISLNEAQRMMQIEMQGQSETNSTLGDGESNNTAKNQSQPVLPNKQALEEDDLMLHPILFTVTMLLFLLSIAVFLGFLRNNIWNLNQLAQKFMTKSQVTKQQHSEALRYQRKFMEYPVPVLKAATQQGFPEPTKGICVPMLYFVTNHRTFDIIVMTVIFLDALGITLEHFGTSDRALILRKHYPSYMLFLYAFEIGCKLYGNGVHFFKSYWNTFDCALVTLCIIDLFASLLSQTWLILLSQNIRFFRILRIFQFYPFIHRAQIIQQLFNSIPRVLYPLGNFLLFYLCLHLAVLSFRLGCSNFILEDQVQASIHWPTVVATPFERISFPFLFQTLGGSTIESYSLQRVFYSSGQILFSLIKISLLVTLCFMLVLVLCQQLTDRDLLKLQLLQTSSTTTAVHSRSHSFHHDHDNRRDGDGGDDDDGHLDCEDKSSYMIPCISPDTIDIETPSSAGTSSRLANHNPNPSGDHNMGGSSPMCGDNVDAAAVDKPNSPLYRTTTITSSEEINGCKVFFVEAMITTV